MANSKLKLGLLGAGGKLIHENGYIDFSHPYGKKFKVRTADIETVTIDTIGMGKGKLKIIGKGATLAEVEMPINWANKAQEWILNQK